MTAPAWTTPRAANRSPLPADAAFMLAGWGDPEPVLIGENPVARFTAGRRSRLAQRLPAELLIVPGGVAPVRSNDTGFRFRPGTDHLWLTGNTVAGSVLLLDTTGGEAAAVLYLPAPSGRDTVEFFDDDQRGDLWVGPRPSPAETQDALGVECRDLARFDGDLARAVRSAQRVRVLPTLDPAVDDLVGRHCGPSFAPHLELKSALDELRLIKSDWEIGQLQQAVDATVRGFTDCAREWSLARASRRGERYLEGTFARRARLDGEDVAYASVVGSGAHAAVLHWSQNTGALHDGELVLMDMGVELASLYCADVTRTLPVTGTFSPLQRELYEVVLRAQQAGIGALRAGVPFADYQDACARSLTADLVGLGLIRSSPDEALAASHHRRWSISRAGHMLGMDVHDCNHAPTGDYLDGRLAAGHCLTVEPGLYFQPNDLTVPAELRGIGIRIEDDLVVTETGAVNLSAALPHRPDDVERWMADASE